MSQSRHLRTQLLAFALTLAGAALVQETASANQWLVYLGGGLEEIEGEWTEESGRVIFTKSGGTLVSVSADDVDLPTSAIITWQAGGRSKEPPRSPLPEAGPPDSAGGAAPPCLEARVLKVRGGETLDIVTPEGRETIHIACLDTPGTQHRFPALAWFGRATVSWLEIEVPIGERICLAETSPPQRDGEGHRIVRVALEDRRDLAATIIESGFGMLATGACRQAAHYRALEESAITDERGHWGPMSTSAAVAAVTQSLAVAAGPPPPRPRRRAGGS